jgi:SAM-dependent methyltransferase
MCRSGDPLYEAFCPDREHDHGVEVDFGRTADDYARHRAGFPQAIVDRLRERGIALPGHRVVDVGTGTGTLARLFALNGCVVIGVDPSRPLLDKAAVLDEEAGATVRYVQATAEGTGLSGESVDAYAAGQCWHWFDRPRAALEAKRLLRSTGALVICHFDWLPLSENVVAATEKLILRYNPEWPLGGGTGFYPAWTVDVADAGFVDIETFSFDVAVPYSAEGWRGRVRASAGVGASLPIQRVERFDRELGELLDQRFSEPLSVPHRMWALTARPPR